MRGTQPWAPFSREQGVASEQHPMFMVSENRLAVKLLREPNHPRGVGATRHQITHENDLVAFARGDFIK